MYSVEGTTNEKLISVCKSTMYISHYISNKLCGQVIGRFTVELIATVKLNY